MEYSPYPSAALQTVVTALFIVLTAIIVSQIMRRYRQSRDWLEIKKSLDWVRELEQKASDPPEGPERSTAVETPLGWSAIGEKPKRQRRRGHLASDAALSGRVAKAVAVLVVLVVAMALLGALVLMGVLFALVLVGLATGGGIAATTRFMTRQSERRDKLVGGSTPPGLR